MGLRGARVDESRRSTTVRMLSRGTQAFPEFSGARRVYYRYERATLLECAT
jgi:hypothetical protein